MSLIVQFFVTLLIVVLSYVVYSFIKLFRVRKKCNWMPSSPRWPILGSIFEFKGPTETLNDLTRITSNPSKMSYLEIVNYTNIIARDYDMMEFVLSSTTLLDKSVDYHYFYPWLGQGLVTAPGLKWKKRRKVITPAFHFSILEQFVEVFNSNAEILIKKLNAEAVNKDSVDIYAYVTACALDVICETAMGVNIETQNNKNQDYVFAVKDMCRIAVARVLSTWRREHILFRFTEDYKKQTKNLKVLHGLTNSVIEKRRRELQGKKTNDSLETDNVGRKRKLAFLDLLLNATIDDQPLSQEDIREEVDTFMFEGHDTTSSAISSALYLLANHQDVQKLVREEQKQIYGKNKDRKTTQQDLQDMKYLDLVIKETLRLYPSVPIIARYVHQDTIYKGHVIPQGIVITLFVYGINRDPDYFEAPEEFRPERFLDTTGKHPYSYVPFSAGPRNCIGQKFAMLEMKSIISKIINNFELAPTDPPHKMKFVSEAVLKSINGVRIRVRKHNWECV